MTQVLVTILTKDLKNQSLSNGQMTDFLLNPWCKRIFGNIKIIIHLKTEPEGRRISEIGGKAESRVRRDAPPSMDDLINPARRDAEVSTELILTDAHGFEEFLKQNLAGMNWRYLLHVVTSMIIHDFHVVGIPTVPFETDPPLIVDPDTVLSFSFSRKGLKPIGRRDSQVLHR